MKSRHSLPKPFWNRKKARLPLLSSSAPPCPHTAAACKPIVLVSEVPPACPPWCVWWWWLGGGGVNGRFPCLSTALVWFDTVALYLGVSDCFRLADSILIWRYSVLTWPDCALPWCGLVLASPVSELTCSDLVLHDLALFCCYPTLACCEPVLAWCYLVQTWCYSTLAWFVYCPGVTQYWRVVTPPHTGLVLLGSCTDLVLLGLGLVWLCTVMVCPSTALLWPQ